MLIPVSNRFLHLYQPFISESGGQSFRSCQALEATLSPTEQTEELYIILFSKATNNSYPDKRLPLLKVSRSQ